MDGERQTDPATRPADSTPRASGARVLALLMKSRVYLLVPLLAILLFEWANVAPYGEFNATFYDEQADALLAGQLSLLRTPSPWLEALPDPWDPVDNVLVRTAKSVPGERFKGPHDLALVHGKFYFQWGLAPAVFLIPLRWIAGHDLPMGHVTFVLEALAALAFAAATLTLARLAGLAPSRLMEAVIVTAFLVCPGWAAALHRVAVYEIAIFSAQLFTGLALLCTALAFERRSKGRSGIWLLALAGTALGIVVNCREDLVPLGLLVPPILWVWWRMGEAARPWRTMIGPALALGAPAATLLGLVLFLNQIRFGSPFETGQLYQLWGGEESVWKGRFIFLDPERLLPNIYYYFLIPVVFNARYPLLIGSPLVTPASWLSPGAAAAYSSYFHRTSGLLVTAPLTLFALAWPLLWRFRQNGADGRLWTIILLLVPAGLATSMVLLAPSDARYGAEWCIWWLVAGSLIAWRTRMAVHARARRSLRLLFDAGLVVTTGWSAWVGAALLLLG
jgi:hypothetical protein